MAVKSYKCFTCGADLKWNPTTNNFKCEYCDSEFVQDDFKDVVENEEARLEEEVASTGEVKVDESTGEEVVAYKCTYCGAEVLTLEETAATFCVYCQRPLVMENSLSGEFKPYGVIPFQKTKEEAMAAFKEYLKGKILVPDVYLEDQNIQKVTGVYLPFWLFDTKMDFNTVFEGKIVRTYSDSNYRYTETKIYDLIRNGDITIDGIPADGSLKTDDDIMNSIEPFDWSKMVPFSTTYLSGFLAEKYDVPAEDCQENVINRVKGSLSEAVTNTCRSYSGITQKTYNTTVASCDHKYVMLPVWLLYTQYNDKGYVFAMNGQTGKFIGDLPIHPPKVKKYQLTKLAQFVPIGIVVASIVKMILEGMGTI